VTIPGGAGLGVRCANLHYHKMRIRSYPGERLLFRFKKTIDDDGAALSRSSPAQACSFAIHYVWSTVYSHTLRVLKDDLAAIGNFLWINCAVPVAQRCTVPRRVRA